MVDRLGLTLATLCWIAASGTVGAKSYPVTERADLAYGPSEEEVGDLYTPTGIATAKPAVVMIHGGGWISGNRAIKGKLGEILAGAGIVVFNIDYRLARPDQPDTRWPAQLVDAQLAVRYLRSHAAELEIDPARIGAIGDSAGGQLALLLGTLRSVVPGDRDGLYPDQRPNVSAVVDEFGPVDIPNMGAGAAENMRLLFGTATPSPAVADQASPLPFLTAQTASTYIIHGHQDGVVPFAQSARLAAALLARQVPHEFITFKGGHGYDGVVAQDVARMQVASFTWLAQQLQVLPR